MGNRDLVPLPVTARKRGFGRIGLALLLGLILLTPAAYFAAAHLSSPEPVVATAVSKPLPMPEAALVPLPVPKPVRESATAPQPKRADRTVPVLPPPPARADAAPLPPPNGPVPAEGWVLEPEAAPPLTTGSIDRRVLVTYANSDIDGRDYRVIKDTGLAACRMSCQSESRCRAYTFNTWENVCFLKASVDFRRIEPRGVSGVLATEAVRLARRPPTVQSVRSRRFPNEPYKVLMRTDFNGCARQCMAESLCLGFNYGKAARSCALLATLDRSVPDHGNDAGMKWQAPVVEVSAMRRRGPSPRRDLPPEATAIFEAVFGQILR